MIDIKFNSVGNSNYNNNNHHWLQRSLLSILIQSPLDFDLVELVELTDTRKET